MLQKFGGILINKILVSVFWMFVCYFLGNVVI